MAKRYGMRKTEAIKLQEIMKKHKKCSESNEFAT